MPQSATSPALTGASLVLVVAVCVISPTGRRLLILLAIPGVPYACYLLGNIYVFAIWPPAVQAVWVLLPGLLAIFVITALARARGASRGQAPPEGSRLAG